MGDFEKFIKWEAATRDTVDFKTIYVDMAGDLVAGLMLSQIVFWHLPDKAGKTKLRVVRDGKAWIAKAHNQWYEEVRITEGQAKRAVGILKGKGIIETAVYRFNGTPMVHLRIVGDCFFKAWNDELDSRESTRPTELVEDVETIQFLTETLSETTSETLSEERQPPAASAAGTRKRAKPRDPRRTSPAIRAIQTVKETKAVPPKEIWDSLIKVLGSEPDIGLLRRCRTEWAIRGYNRNSYAWALEWYEQGGPPKRNGGGVAEPAGMAGIREYRRQHNMVDTHGK